jgi:hypothetical protein
MVQAVDFPLFMVDTNEEAMGMVDLQPEVIPAAVLLHLFSYGE